MDDLARLHARIAELEEQVRARDDFVATAAHELRNPMGAFILQVQHLILLSEDNPVHSPLLPKLHAIERQLQGYTRRATTLLELSRILSGNFTPQLETVYLSALVQDAVTLYAPQSERAGCKVEMTMAETVSGQWDPSALELVTHNLLSNAIKYGPGKPIAVTVSESEGWAQLQIRDNGIGISAADQQRIFERFERAVMRRTSGGFGLGLWITQQLVHSLGGHITVHSETGKGSTFEVALPTKENA